MATKPTLSEEIESTEKDLSVWVELRKTMGKAGWFGYMVDQRIGHWRGYLAHLRRRQETEGHNHTGRKRN